MTLRPSRWYPIALILSGLNIGAAALTAGGLHATAHAVLAAGLAVWASRLHSRRDDETDGGEHGQIEDGVEALDADVDQLRRELSEMHERLDFAERMLAQRPPAEPRR
jgi:hypothetical protein